MTTRKTAKKATKRPAARRGAAGSKSKASTSSKASEKPAEEPDSKPKPNARSSASKPSTAKPKTTKDETTGDKSVHPGRVQTFSNSDDFRDHYMEKYGLADHMVWHARDNKSGRISYILRQAAVELIAAHEGILFSDPVYHEKPGMALVYDRPPLLPGTIQHDPAVQVSVQMLQEKKSGSSPNSGRYALEGRATTKAMAEQGLPPVTAYASASEGGSGDGAGYSTFIAAHNRLKARLVLALTGANMHSFYSDVESEAFEPIEGDNALDDPAPAVESNEPPPPASTPDFSNAKTTRTQTRKSPKPVNDKAEPEKPKSRSRSKKAEEKSGQFASPVTDSGDETTPRPEKSEEWFGQKTEARIATYSKLEPNECYGWILEEIERAKNAHHLGNLWLHILGLIDKMAFPKDAVADLNSAKGAKESAFARSNVMNDDSVETADREDTPEAVAIAICDEYMECETMEELRDRFIGNEQKSIRIRKTKPDGEKLYQQMIDAKDTRKAQLEAQG